MTLRRWLQRYGPAEIAGMAGTFAAFYLAQAMTANPYVLAYSGTLGENIGFYGLIVVRQIQTDARAAHLAGKPFGFTGAAATFGHLGFEFGVAETADALLVRPVALHLGTKLLGTVYGLIVGKIAADIVFYVIAMFFHDLRPTEN